MQIWLSAVTLNEHEKQTKRNRSCGRAETNDKRPKHVAKREKNGHFAKGESGNPYGRPKKGQTFPDILARVMEEQKKTLQLNGEERECDAKELMCMALVSLALDKKSPPNIRLSAIKECKEWVDGKSVQQVEMTGELAHKKANIADMIDLNKLSPDEAEVLGKVLDKNETEPAD